MAPMPAAAHTPTARSTRSTIIRTVLVRRFCQQTSESCRFHFSLTVAVSDSCVNVINGLIDKPCPASLDCSTASQYSHSVIFEHIFM